MRLNNHHPFANISDTRQTGTWWCNRCCYWWIHTIHTNTTRDQNIASGTNVPEYHHLKRWSDIKLYDDGISPNVCFLTWVPLKIRSSPLISHLLDKTVCKYSQFTHTAASSHNLYAQVTHNNLAYCCEELTINELTTQKWLQYWWWFKFLFIYKFGKRVLRSQISFLKVTEE